VLPVHAHAGTAATTCSSCRRDSGRHAESTPGPCDLASGGLSGSEGLVDARQLNGELLPCAWAHPLRITSRAAYDDLIQLMRPRARGKRAGGGISGRAHVAVIAATAHSPAPWSCPWLRSAHSSAVRPRSHARAPAAPRIRGLCSAAGSNRTLAHGIPRTS